MGLKQILERQDKAIWLRLIGFFLGFQWFSAGIEKLLDPNFAGALPKTLGFFASQNPSGWMVSLINNYFIPQAGVFAVLVSWGETLGGLALMLGLLTNLALLGLIFLNSVFFLAAGWTGPSTLGLNLLMGFLEVVLLLASGSKYISFDEMIAQKFPRIKKLLLSL